MSPTVTHPRSARALAIFAVIPALATPGLGYSQQALEVLSCQFECKLTVGNDDFWAETSTLSITNNHPPIPDSSDTHAAHVLILDARGDGILRSQVNLSGWDTDELHICRMLNRAGNRIDSNCIEAQKFDFAYCRRIGRFGSSSTQFERAFCGGG